MVNNLIEMATQDFATGELTRDQPQEAMWFSYMASMMATILVLQDQLKAAAILNETPGEDHVE